MPGPVYTHKSRVFIYQQLRQQVGPYVFDKWVSGHPSKRFLPLAKWISILENVYAAYVKAYESGKSDFPGKPKSWGAIRAQIGFCVTRQSNAGLHPHHREVVHQNRMAAYEAGFMTQTDILKLEQRQGVK